ncbi:uncharacterized protein LOC129596559 [Paramacrobiotus metropolitanus]|uniref:uncharacterized protein LOC129596559 n=1 Tax=Paramacrobiotus metropolitanus TaxID=2943436 RepID=UPI002445FA0A|nr:uncharacterized protein LOC129596559 [Paramacrobiotus metropolitanus]
MFKNKVWLYGAVAVQDDNKSFRQGMITDVLPVERSFIVDFDYPDHHAEIVPLDRCFGPISPDFHGLDSFAPGDSIEVLCRSREQDAWRWTPAIVIAGSNETFAFVEMERNGKTVRQVVSRLHVQNTAERESIDFGRYQRYSVQLSRPLLQLASACSQEDLHWWNRRHGSDSPALLVKIEEGCLIYITRGPKPHSRFAPGNFEELAEIFRRMADRSRGSENPRTSAPKGRLHCGFEQGQKEPDTGILPACINAILPPESISHIFSFLEIRDRIRCRLVCRTWQDISMLCVLPVKIEVCSYLPDDFAMAVDHCVTHGTKTLIFQCYHCQCERVHRALETLFSLLQVKDIRLKTIVFSKCDVWADDILAFSDALVLKFRLKLHGICDILVLDNVRVCGLPYVDAETCHCISTQKTGFFCVEHIGPGCGRGGGEVRDCYR